MRRVAACLLTLIAATASAQIYPWDRRVAKVSAKEQPVYDVLDEIFRQAGVPYRGRPYLMRSDRVTIELTHVSLEAALIRLGEKAGFKFHREGLAYVIDQGELSGFVPEGPAESPIFFASAQGRDWITRSRMLSLGKALGAPIYCSEGSNGFDFYSARKDVERVQRAFFADSDLSAAAMCTCYIVSVDRFPSLPIHSFEGGPNPLARRSVAVRQLERQGWRQVRIAEADRAMGYGPATRWAKDVYVELQRSKEKPRIVRFQLIGGVAFECGEVSDWPRSYANRWQKNTDANWPMTEADTHPVPIEGQPQEPAFPSQKRRLAAERPEAGGVRRA